MYFWAIFVFYYLDPGWQNHFFSILWLYNCKNWFIFVKFRVYSYIKMAYYIKIIVCYFHFWRLHAIVPRSIKHGCLINFFLSSQRSNVDSVTQSWVHFLASDHFRIIFILLMIWVWTRLGVLPRLTLFLKLFQNDK